MKQILTLLLFAKSVNGRGMSPGSVPAVLRNLIRRATNGTHRSGSNVMKTISDSFDNCKRKLRINSKGHRVTFQSARATLSSSAAHTSARSRVYEGQPIGNATAWSMDLYLVKLDAPLDKPVCLGADFEKCTGPFYVVHCVNTGMKFLIDTDAAISLLPVRNVPIGVTVQHSDIVIEGISGETQRAVGKVDLNMQPELSGKFFNVTFHVVPKTVFNLLGANFTDRYELANIIAFQARRLRAEDTHVVARTMVVSDSTTDKLTLDEAHLLAVQFDRGLSAFPEPRVTLNKA